MLKADVLINNINLDPAVLDPDTYNAAKGKWQ